jgi:hypothetical protein
MPVEQTSATSRAAASAPPSQADPAADAQAADAHAADAHVDSPSPASPPGFGARGRVRRRARFLRKARELAYRDLGGLVFNLHRFAQRNDSLVLAKLATLTRIDAELRGLEAALGERQPITVLREAGITACPRCAAIHSGEDRFCPNCGLPLSRRSDLPIAGAPAAAPAPAAASAHASASGAYAGAPAPAAGAAATAEPRSPAPSIQPQPATSSDPAPAMPTPAAPPARPPVAPATQEPATIAPGGDRLAPSPVPPVAAPSGRPAPDGDEDQPTEIIRPRTGGA